MSENYGYPPAPRDLGEYHLGKIHEYLSEDRARLYETRGAIREAFGTARKELLGTNNLQTLRIVAKKSMTFFDGKNIKIDDSGWNPANEKLRIAFDTIDYSHSVIYDIYVNAIQVLRESDALPKLNITQPMTADGQILPYKLVQAQPGFFDRLTGKIGNAMKPSWAKKGDRALSMVSDLFDYMNRTRERWETYRTTHWDNVSKAIDWDAGEFVYELVEELEALDDCAMRTIFLVDIGYRHLTREHRHDLINIAKSMVESRQLSLSNMQQVPNIMASLPQQSQPPQVTIQNVQPRAGSEDWS